MQEMRKGVVMKTCATCNNLKVNGEPYYCTHHAFYMCSKASQITSCPSYEEKREPIRLECECKWVLESDGESLFYRPSEDYIFEKLDKFNGKRTRLVIEEIV